MNSMSWLTTTAATDRLRRGVAGRRNLLSAIQDLGHQLIEVQWDSQSRDVPEIGETPIVVYGGHRFLEAVASARPALTAGIFHSPAAHSFGIVHRHLCNRMLSPQPALLRFDEAKARIRSEGPMFLRPDLCEKAFTGGVYGPDDLDDIDAEPELEVVLARPVHIRAEYRIIVADGAPVTGCQYRRDARLDIRIDVSDQALEAASRAARIYAPARIYTCDVAETDKGFKVIEYNSFSSSGLYACDGRAIVQAAARVML